MKKWILLLAVIVGILWSANWSYHQLDQVILITEFWQNTDAQDWKLVNFKEEKPTIYAFTSLQGYWPIFLGLWPVFTLFTLIIIVMIPLVFYIYNQLSNHEIFAAKEASAKAIKLANINIMEAEENERQTKKSAESRISNAYMKQREIARQELVEESQKLQELKRSVEQRESKISEREHDAQQAQQKAEKNKLDIRQLYDQEKKKFDEGMAEMARARDNAQAGYQRLKNRKPKNKTAKL